MRVALYCRVSTVGQSDQAQYDDLVAMCQRSNWTIVRTYRETVSGTKSIDSRPQLRLLVADARKRYFDRVVVWSVDRLGRSLSQLVTVLNELHQLDIAFFAYKQAIDTSTPMGQSMWGLLGVFAQLENDLRRERQASGIVKARANGVRFGRPSLPKSKCHEVIRLRDAGLSITKIAAATSTSNGSVHRILKRNKNALCLPNINPRCV